MVRIGGGASGGGSTPSGNKLNVQVRYQQELELAPAAEMVLTQMNSGTLTFLHVNVVGTASKLVNVLRDNTDTFASGAIPTSGNLELFTAFVWNNDPISLKNAGTVNDMAVNCVSANIEGIAVDLTLP